MEEEEQNRKFNLLLILFPLFLKIHQILLPLHRLRLLELKPNRTLIPQSLSLSLLSLSLSLSIYTRIKFKVPFELQQPPHLF